MCFLLILRPQTAKTNMAANVQFLYPSAAYHMRVRHIEELKNSVSLNVWRFDWFLVPQRSQYNQECDFADMKPTYGNFTVT